MNKGFAHCTDCDVYCDIPNGFKETKHFVKCPKCNNPMYLSRGITPEEIGLKETKKVIGSLMLHGEKI